MRLRRYTTLLTAQLLCCLSALAQSVNVSVSALRDVLPPQVMCYLSNPGQYFNITLQNPSSEPARLYFGAEIRQLTPASGLEIVVPGKTMPRQPVEVGAGATRVLTAGEMRTMFDHVRMEDVTMPAGLFDDVTSGAFGNLPEGTYEIVINAYRWDPAATQPELVGNPLASRTMFRVCYQAKAPEWLTPMTMGGFGSDGVAVLPKQSPVMAWTAPQVSCDPRPRQYAYDLKVVQQLPLQAPDEAIDRNPVVYRATGLSASQCVLPVTVANSLSPHETYVAQVTASSSATRQGAPDYIHILNEGRSDLRLFRVRDLAAGDTIAPPDSLAADSAATDSIRIIGMGGDGDAPDSLYVFSSPRIVTPYFSPDAGARKLFTGDALNLAWERPKYQAGEGLRQDTIQFAYDVELYVAPGPRPVEELLEGAPAYELRQTRQLCDSIRWTELEGKLRLGDYVYLRVVPHAVNERSVHFMADSLNAFDAAVAERTAPSYFRCATQVEVDNDRPTTLSADALRGKSVKVGEYELVLDGELKAVEGRDGHFRGDGHVVWEPLLMTWKLAVKFDDIAINTASQVYEGTVETWGGRENKMTSAAVVDKLFSDWGIDNLIGDTRIPYAGQIQQKVNGKIRGLADQMPEIATYYKEYQQGKARAAGLLDGNLENVTFPLAIPDKYNPTPVGLTINKMKFTPGYATMDLFGTCVVPESEVTQRQILVFGAPRLCVSPKSLVPEGGTVALLKDFTIEERRSGFECTFKAPADVLEPQDGCFVAWGDNKFGALSLDVDLRMPDDLRKVDAQGNATAESPVLNLRTEIERWEDFVVTATMEPFEHVDLPGFTFEAANVVVDLSQTKNHAKMRFPAEGYDKQKAGISTGQDELWEGLYIEKVAMRFPKAIKIGNGDSRMELAMENMLIDASGVTLDAGANNLIDYAAGKEGRIDGFRYTLDKLFVSIIQNQFNKFGFAGKLNLPLLKGTVDYTCDIYNQTFTGKGTRQGYAYVFKTSQVDDLDFDFMLGDLKLDKDLTYFLVEALPDEAGELRTNAELLVGGEVTVAGAETVRRKTADLPFDLSLPEIRFCNMRVANGKAFEAAYAGDLQRRAREAAERMEAEVEGGRFGWWNEAKDIELCDGKLVVNFGQWGAASPQKKVGPFKFTLTDWGFDLRAGDGQPYVAVTLGGDITFCDELDVTAGTTIEIQADVKNPTDYTRIELDYRRTKFCEARFGMEGAAFSFSGVLSVEGDEGSLATQDKGYKGKIACEVAGGLFTLEVQGGYFDHKEEGNNYAWGFFDVMAGGKCGIPIPPISIDGIHGGIYINCAYNAKDVYNPKPRRGAIGVVFGMGIATADKVTLSGDLDLTVAYDKQTRTLTSFIFQGSVKAVGGMVNSRVKMVYENNEQEQYFQLDLTVDAAMDGGMGDLLRELNSELEDSYIDPEEAGSAFRGAVGDKTDSKSDYEKKMKEYEKKKKKDKDKTDDGVSVSGPSLRVSLDVRVAHVKGTGKTRWHVYLGEPDPDKRCEFRLVDFKSKIVSVSIGANAYLCLGNELPGDGKLPEIPAKVRKFLDGGSHGGVKSDGMAAATSAQRRIENQFASDAAINGGVMVGASVWGYVNVDLGLFYGDMGATAGFDVSVRKLKDNMTCVNLKSKPGHNGWYGEGQLYAYLYAKFGFRIYLGFFNKKIDLVDAGIGGVLRCAMPNPNYFTGKARVKLKLLGGLVKLDKKFSFECGDVCEMFYGNALDDYKLFEGCNIGSESWDKAAESPIDWELPDVPVIDTQTDLNTEIKVCDPTTEQELLKGTAGDNYDEEAIKDMAGRMFKFVIDTRRKPTLTEYASLSDAKSGRGGRTSEVDYTVEGDKVTCHVTQFNKGRYYKLSVTGRSLEFRNGRWDNPENFDTIQNKYINKEWVQTKDFYFATNSATRTYEDAEDLQPYVKVAYPNANGYNLLNNNGTPGALSSPTVYAQDVQHPTISLDRKLRGKVYQKGTLRWTLYNASTDALLSSSGNNWIENDSVSVLTPTAALANVGTGYRRLKLTYTWQETVKEAATWKLHNRSVVYGTSREAVKAKTEQAMADEYRRLFGGKSTRWPKFRVDVTQVTYANLSGDGDDTETASRLRINRRNDGSNQRRGAVNVLEDKGQLMFIVKTYVYGTTSRVVTHTKDLVDLRVYVPSSAPAIDNVFDSPATYCGKFFATRLDGVVYNERGYTSPDAGMLLTAANQSPSASYIPSYTLGGQKNYYITTDPFMYVGYLGRMFFIGGHLYNSASKNLAYYQSSTESLWLATPYGNWKGGVLGSKYDNYQLADGCKAVRSMAVMDRGRVYGVKRTLYPLYTDGSDAYQNALGQETGGLVTWHRLNEATFARVFADYYATADRLTKDLQRNLEYQSTWSKATMRTQLGLRQHETLKYTGNYPGTGVSLNLRWYQYAIVWNAAGRCGLDISKTIELANNSARHIRIKGDEYLGRKLYFSFFKDKSLVDKAFQAKHEYVGFDAKKICEMNNLYLRFTRYRVNAWNLKDKRWTVFNPAALGGANARYGSSYNRSFKDLVAKYKLQVTY